MNEAGQKGKEFGHRKLPLKEYACKGIGIDCPWKHREKTEERLLDAAALHLRDVHGFQSLDTGMIGKIKNSFREPSSAPSYETEVPVMKEFRCRDIGMECDWRYLAQTEELIVDGAAVHARDVHGIREFTPDMIVKVKNAIHEWKEEKTAA